jgi:hypothetical protein
MYLAALDTQRRVVVPDSIRIGRVEQAVNLPIWVVEELDLADAEFIACAVLCILSQLIDRLGWQI